MKQIFMVFVVLGIVMLLAYGGCSNSDNGANQNDQYGNGTSVPDFNDDGSEDAGSGKACLTNTDCPVNEECINSLCSKLGSGDAGDTDSSADTGVKKDAGGETDAGGDAGEQLQKELEIFPEVLDFGIVEAGKAVVKTLSITNIGSRDISITKIHFDEVTSADFTFTPNPFAEVTLSAGQSTSINVTYTPPDSSQDNGILLIENTSNDPTIEVYLTSHAKDLSDIGFYDSKDPSKKIYPLEGGGEFSINFSTLELQQKEDIVYIIKNDGPNSSALVINSCALETLEGTSYEQFKVQLLDKPNGKAVSTPATVEGGKEIAVRFTYQPLSAGVHNAKVTIETNDDDVNNDGQTGDNIISVSLSGRGGIKEANIVVTPPEIDFGQLNIGENKCEELQIENTSADTTLELQVAFVGGSGDFSMGKPPTKIEPEQKTNLEICFEPQYKGSVEKTLRITSNAGNSPTLDVLLKGEGVSLELLISPPSPIAFGDVVIGSKIEKPVTIRNTGSGTITVSSIVITGINEFSISSISRTLPCDLTNGGGSISVSVAFQPSAAGEVTADLKISHNSNSDGYSTVLLGGNGITPSDAQIEVTPSPLDFGSVRIGENSIRSLTVQNTGTVDLNIASVYLQSSGIDFYIATSPTKIKASQSGTIEVNFSPSEAGARSNVLVITSDAKNSPVTKINLTGVGDDSCVPDTTLADDCEKCGTKTSICTGEGVWGPWGECVNQGLCSPGDTQTESCGTCGGGSHTRTCQMDCTWGLWGVCSCRTDQETEQCPTAPPTCSCYTRTRTCLAGVCEWGSWSACSGGSCMCGSEEQQTCNVCGTMTKTCNESCAWESWTYCSQPDDELGLQNDTSSAAIDIGGGNDCDKTVKTVTAKIIPAGDVDWYKSSHSDDWEIWGSCDSDLTVQLKAASGSSININDYYLLVYFAFIEGNCKNSPDCVKTCTRTSNPLCADVPDGYTGCIADWDGTTKDIKIRNCFTEGPDDSGYVMIKVIPKTSTTGSCEPYEIRVQHGS